MVLFYVFVLWILFLYNLTFSRPLFFTLSFENFVRCISGSLFPLFGIPDEPPCYVWQCKLKCIFDLYEICLLECCLAVLKWHIPCSLCVRQNKRGTCQERINTTNCINYDTIYLQYNKDVHESLLI